MKMANFVCCVATSRSATHARATAASFRSGMARRLRDRIERHVRPIDVPWRYRPFTSEAGLRPELAAQGIHLHIGDVRRELFQFGGIRPLDLYVYSDFRGSFSDPVKPDSEKELSPFCVP